MAGGTTYVFISSFDTSDEGDLEVLAMIAGDDPDANMAAGRGFFDRGDYGRALPHLRRAADGGSSEALAYLAEMHYRGLGVPTDREEALRLNIRGAEAGELYCIYTLGMMYRGGVATEPDPERAFELISQAADRGYPQALNVMGGYYMEGRQVEWDLRKAEDYLIEAVRLGDRRAARNLEVLRSLEEGEAAEMIALPKGEDPPTGRGGRDAV